ncbi:hypothetical protein KSP40_PGU015356 [Platanthera guangdongensis]|uniref:Uncharacterized protein n=1 Tax=Platanthera guangdongensis TaxID=2320717 RepID=A0ABR2N3Y4_9ASPA
MELDGGIAEPFPEINTSNQLNLGVPEDFPVDPISSKLDTAKFYREEEEAATVRARANESEKPNQGSTLLPTLIISGVVAAAITAAFIVSKRLKNTS